LPPESSPRRGDARCTRHGDPKPVASAVSCRVVNAPADPFERPPGQVQAKAEPPDACLTSVLTTLERLVDPHCVGRVNGAAPIAHDDLGLVAAWPHVDVDGRSGLRIANGVGEHVEQHLTENCGVAPRSS
jgi:hypothetical protein